MKNRNTILAYHSVGANPIGEAGAELYCVPEARFREQMECVAQVARSQSHKVTSVVVTFDDGDITNYTNAFPVLKELGLTAHFFIIGNRIGTPGYMSWEQIKELRGAGMKIGSHGMTHRILTELSDAELGYELNESRKILEKNLKATVNTFSVPRGFCNERVINAAERTGYKAIFTSDLKDADDFKLGRIIVRPNWDLSHFIKVLNSGYSLRDKAENLVKNSLKAVLGAKNYDKIRTKVL